MATMSATINGWASRQSATWYPSSSSFTGLSSAPGSLNPAKVSDPSGSNKYGVVFKITTPSHGSISSISAITININLKDANTTAGTIYGSLRTVYHNTSNTSDTASTFRNNAIGSEASASPGSSYSSVAFTFYGSISQNTSYYLWIYTKSTSDIYDVQCTSAHSAYITYTKTTYTVSYNANGGSGAPSYQSKDYDGSVTISYTEPYKATSNSSSTYVITGHANGGYFGSVGTETYKINATRTTPTSYTFSHWNTRNDGTGTSYYAGDTYSANASVVLYAIYSETVGNAIFSNNDISLLQTPSRDDAVSDTYTVTLDANGGYCYYSSLSKDVIRQFTFTGWGVSQESNSPNAEGNYNYEITLYACWNYVDIFGKLNLPTPTKDNYKFLGWSRNTSSYMIVSNPYTPEATTILYAIWEQDSSTIYYNNNGEAVKCFVYFNNNGDTVQVNVFYNNNGEAVRCQ